MVAPSTHNVSAICNVVRRQEQALLACIFSDSVLTSERPTVSSATDQSATSGLQLVGGAAAGSLERGEPATPTGRSHHAVRACAFIGNGPNAGGGMRRFEAAS